MGYSRAGFTEIVGVDNQPQKSYPFEFVQADALEYLAEHGHEFDAIHASPPCQGYSIMNNLPWLKGRDYPLLILPVREMLEGLGKPYVIENVMGARHGAKGLGKRGLEAHGLQAGWLCGSMFGLPFFRHRLFATNWFWLAPGHPRHQIKQGMPGAPRPRDSWEKGYEERHPGESKQAALASESTDARGIASWLGRRGVPAGLQTKTGITEWVAQSGQVMGHATVGMDDPKRNNRDGQSYPQHAGAAWRLTAEAMGIDWMKRNELSQAIPPAYTEYIGQALLPLL